MKKCKYFDEDYSTISGAPCSRCLGTKEKELCACGGDELKCDFYPKNKDKASRSNVTDIVTEIESILMASDTNWMLSYNPDSKSYSITIFKEDENND